MDWGATDKTLGQLLILSSFVCAKVVNVRRFYDNLFYIIIIYKKSFNNFQAGCREYT